MTRFNLLVVCAWCGKSLGSVPCLVEPSGVSHGICPACMVKQLAEIKATIWPKLAEVRP